ncbi:IS5 family transposase [Mycobacterium sp. URHB0021]
MLNDVSIKAQSVPELQEHHPQMVVDNADGVILDHSVEVGNPADAPQLAPAIARIPGRTDRAPTTVAADRGHGYASLEADLHAPWPRETAPTAATGPHRQPHRKVPHAINSFSGRSS